jgi:hypothetical protein
MPTTLRQLQKKDRAEKGPQVYKLAAGPQSRRAGQDYGRAVVRQNRYRDFKARPIVTLAQDLHEGTRKGITQAGGEFTEWDGLDAVQRAALQTQAKHIMAAYVIRPAG